MTYQIKVSKQGIDVLGTGGTVPNNLIFDSNLNTFKIVASGTFQGTVANGAVGTLSGAHGLSFTPPVSGFVLQMAGTTKQRSLPVGGVDYTTSTVYNFAVTNAYADGTNNYFVIDSNFLGSVYVVRYYNFEIPLT